MSLLFSGSLTLANIKVGVKPFLPVASFTWAYGGSTLIYNFTDTSTNAPYSWSWDFGDGATSTAKNPTHTYSYNGIYTVSLTVTNATGNNTTTQQITIEDGADPYWANVSLLINGDQSPVLDIAGNGLTLIGASNAPTQNTSTYKYGAGSVYFNGAGAYSIPYTTAFNLNSTDWTMECWFNPDRLNVAQLIISKDTHGTNYDWGIDIISATQIGIYSSATTTSHVVTVPTMSVGTWYHVAIVRYGTDITIYLNGTSYGTKTMNLSNSDIDHLTVGCGSWNSPQGFFKGYVDDLRLTKGVARYTGNFTPPTTKMPTHG